MGIQYKRKFFSIIAVVILMSAVPFTSYATTTREKLDQAEQEKEDTQEKLEDTQENIEGLKEEQNTLKGMLSNLNSQLGQVSDNLEELEEQISTTELEIEVTQKALDEAMTVEEEQYEAMKKRIQFMYERQDFVLIEMLLNTGSFAEFLNYSNYLEQIAEYDKKMLEEYKETVRLIEEEEKRLQEEKETLEDLKAKAEVEKSRVAGLVSSTTNNIAQYSDQISDAEAKALEYERELKETEENIEYLKKKLAEEIAMSQLAANSARRDISEVSFADGDRYLLANLIYCEAGGEPYEGQVAVGAVVITRVLSSVYPDTVVGVIYQNKQFSPVASGRLALALAEGRATADCYRAADEAMAGVTNVGNCVYFRTPIEGLSGTQIGGHIFY
ncbi:MAG: cell wall hydrolase [Lachnospiraceae bacterium]|nr:cell wall hydrolase [Lachnospiraceae bacterium]